jgi:hypothetical protein
MENEKLSGFTEAKFLGISTFHKDLPPSNETTESKFLEDKDYPTSINEFLEKKKKEIPLYDPYTGEPNPEYEKLTGKPNPLLSDKMLNKAPIVFEPKLKNRFLVHLPKELMIPCYFISSVEKPDIYIKEKKIFGLTYSRKRIYSEINLTIRDFIGNDVNKLITYLETNKKFSLNIEILDPTGAVIDNYFLDNCVINSINFGESNYESNNINLISLMIKYNKLTIK